MSDESKRDPNLWNLEGEDFQFLRDCGIKTHGEGDMFYQRPVTEEELQRRYGRDLSPDDAVERTKLKELI